MRRNFSNISGDDLSEISLGAASNHFGDELAVRVEGREAFLDCTDMPGFGRIEMRTVIETATANMGAIRQLVETLAVLGSDIDSKMKVLSQLKEQLKMLKEYYEIHLKELMALDKEAKPVVSDLQQNVSREREDSKSLCSAADGHDDVPTLPEEDMGEAYEEDCAFVLNTLSREIQSRRSHLNKVERDCAALSLKIEHYRTKNHDIALQVQALKVQKTQASAMAPLRELVLTDQDKRTLGLLGREGRRRNVPGSVIPQAPSGVARAFGGRDALFQPGTRQRQHQHSSAAPAGTSSSVSPFEL